MKTKYTLRDLLRDFGTVEQCLEFMRERRFPDGIRCRKCRRLTGHRLRLSHKAYACNRCGTMISPTKDTIFHRSKIGLPDWFLVIYTMAQTRTGIAAAQIERQLGIGYKAALRMCNKIRSCLEEDHFLAGTCEIDETYVGGKPRRTGFSKRGRGTNKQPVFAMVERGGRAVARVVPNVQRDTLFPIILDTVEEGTTINSDEFNVYATLNEFGYEHKTIHHKKKQYARIDEEGDLVTTNSCEGFFQSPKGAIRSVHRGVSRQHMQGYWNEYAFRYSHRNDEQHMFFAILDQVVQAESSSLAA